MRKRKNDDIDQPPKKKKNGCVMFLAAFSLLVLLFSGGYIVFGRSSGAIPIYTGVEPEQSNYVTKNAGYVLSCPNYEDDDCKPIAALTENTLLQLDDYEYGGYFGDSDVWYVVDVDGQKGFVPYNAVDPISAEQAIEINAIIVSSTEQPTTQVVPTNTSVPPTTAPKATTNSGTSCPSMSATCSQLTCAQAYACLRAGKSSLDRDKDGVPCESICPGG